ncbi:hypothetical protein EDB81DRAFT_782159 [Dactylonectria macrodidyma]|uniref:C2H2-type domain-containing protein n=1 Tax=Dactylonectria macrodidyma TaxID=307937 RepID=A0A9P9JNB0_9HYPO|nr:hypothetical protein EDB81DRAFT_782159 [Dactylonectria macrodidyma]
MELLHVPASDAAACHVAEICPHVPVPNTGHCFDMRPTHIPPQTHPPVQDRTIRACEGAIQRVINRLLVDGLRIEPPSPAVLGEAIDGCSRGLGGAPTWGSRTGHLPAEKEPLPAGIRERILSSEFDFFGQRVNQGAASENLADHLPLLSDIPGILDGLDSTALSRTWLAVRTAWLSERSAHGDMKAAGPLSIKRVNQDGSKKELAEYSHASKRTASQTSDLPPKAGLKRRRVVVSGRHGAGDDEDDNKDHGSHGDDPHPSSPHGDEASGESRPFACPFYKLNRANYMDCINLRLSRICDVKQHLGRRHSQQPFCPTCYATFLSTSIRDDHIRSRCCEASATTRVNPQGISPEAMDLVKKRSRLNLSPADRWYVIWDIVFKDEPRPSTPYLGSVLVEAIGIIRSSWTQEAPRITAAFPHNHSAQSRDKCDFEPLFMYVLSDLQSRFEQSDSGLDFAGAPANKSNHRQIQGTARNGPLASAASPAAPLSCRSQNSGNAWHRIDDSVRALSSHSELLQPPLINVVPAMEEFNWDQGQQLATTLGDETAILGPALDFDEAWSQSL